MVIFVDRAMLPGGWADDVRIELAADGTIARVEPNGSREGAVYVRGTLLPGMPNAHSHAFQRAMAGRAERSAGFANDDFWSWRGQMYALANRLSPDDLYAIARDVYREMLAAGYTSVAEFHYIHRDPAGTWYGERAVMAKALIAAAREAGIAITLLPALYAHGGVGGEPLGDAQRRFATTVDDVLAIAEDVRSAFSADADVIVGVCAHSLRAATIEEIGDLLNGSPRDVPMHMHVAEQYDEVSACEERLGMAPVALLFANFPIDARWTFVHATMAMLDDLTRLARSGATVALAPTTEANLGDGLFSLDWYLHRNGVIAIGSDSNVSVDVREELRWLEYGQRTSKRQRTIAPQLAGESTGETLYRAALKGGAASLGRRCGVIAPGAYADFVTLDSARDDRDNVIDRYIFASKPPRPSAVMVSGRWVTPIP